MSDTTAAAPSFTGRQIADAVVVMLRNSGLKSLYGDGRLKLTEEERAELAADVLEQLAERVPA
jgi:hypothetical protein